MKPWPDFMPDPPRVARERVRRLTPAALWERSDRQARLFQHRYGRGYAWGFAGKDLPQTAPEEWLVGYHDGFAAAVAILHEDELR